MRGVEGGVGQSLGRTLNDLFTNGITKKLTRYLGRVLFALLVLLVVQQLKFGYYAFTCCGRCYNTLSLNSSSALEGFGTN